MINKLPNFIVYFFCRCCCSKRSSSFIIIKYYNYNNNYYQFTKYNKDQCHLLPTLYNSNYIIIIVPIYNKYKSYQKVFR